MIERDTLGGINNTTSISLALAQFRRHEHHFSKSAVDNKYRNCLHTDGLVEIL
jgi:hypothetical protein